MGFPYFSFKKTFLFKEFLKVTVHGQTKREETDSAKQLKKKQVSFSLKVPGGLTFLNDSNPHRGETGRREKITVNHGLFLMVFVERISRFTPPYFFQGDNTNRIDAVVEGLRNNVQGALRVIAEATGGVATSESNDARKQLREMIVDAQSYYELSYDPKIDDYNGLLRKTTFKLKQGDYKVRGRTGYLATAPGQENLLPYEVPLMKALSQTPLTREVDFQAGTWKLQSTQDNVQAMVAVEVPFATSSMCSIA